MYKPLDMVSLMCSTTMLHIHTMQLTCFGSLHMLAAQHSVPVLEQIIKQFGTKEMTPNPLFPPYVNGQCPLSLRPMT